MILQGHLLGLRSSLASQALEDAINSGGSVLFLLTYRFILQNYDPDHQSTVTAVIYTMATKPPTVNATSPALVILFYATPFQCK